MKHLVTASLPFALAFPLAAQSLLHTHVLPTGWFVQLMRPAGDTNGDGVEDFAAFVNDESLAGAFRVFVIASGATGLPLHVLPDAALANEREIVRLGDVNADGRSDVLLVMADRLRLYSGATGLVLWSVLPAPGESFRSACELGDHDGNGRPDVAVVVYANGNDVLRRMRGENGAPLGTITTQSNNNSVSMVRALGDVSGDGKIDLAYSPGNSSVQAFDSATGATVWLAAPIGADSNRVIDTLDVDGDGKRELFLFRPQVMALGVHGTMAVHDGATGAVRFVQANPVGDGVGTVVAAVGDLDQNGTRDYVQWFSRDGVRGVHARSGNDGRRLWSRPNWSTHELRQWVVGLGDVDGDGYGDFAQHAGDGYVADRWIVLSGRVLAESQPQTGACGAGPFLPRLGATRPILGQTLTIAGQDAPLGTAGILALSLQPTSPTWLGASSCFAWFDLGSAIALAAPAPPQWTLPLPLPLVPQLAGFELALQAWYAPTTGPLGFDLSNGVWLRLGYQ